MTATADCGHPQERKLMMLLCKDCEHWNQIEKIKELEKETFPLDPFVKKIKELEAEVKRYRNAKPGYYKDSDVAKLESNLSVAVKALEHYATLESQYHYSPEEAEEALNDIERK